MTNNKRIVKQKHDLPHQIRVQIKIYLNIIFKEKLGVKVFHDGSPLISMHVYPQQMMFGG